MSFALASCSRIERKTHEDHARNQTSSHQPLHPAEPPSHPGARVRAENVLASDEELLEDERESEEKGEGPGEDNSEGEEERSEVDSTSRSRSVGGGRLEVEGVGEESRVHGCRRGEEGWKERREGTSAIDLRDASVVETKLTSRSVPHSCREKHSEEEVSTDAIVDVLDDGSIEASLDEGADEGREDSNTEESLSLWEGRKGEEQGELCEL